MLHLGRRKKKNIKKLTIRDCQSIRSCQRTTLFFYPVSLSFSLSFFHYVFFIRRKQKSSMKGDSERMRKREREKKPDDRRFRSRPIKEAGSFVLTFSVRFVLSSERWCVISRYLLEPWQTKITRRSRSSALLFSSMLSRDIHHTYYCYKNLTRLSLITFIVPMVTLQATVHVYPSSSVILSFQANSTYNVVLQQQSQLSISNFKLQ